MDRGQPCPRVTDSEWLATIDRISFEEAGPASKATAYIVFVTGTEDSYRIPEKLEQIKAGLTAKLKDTLTKLGWQGKGAVPVLIDDTSLFVLRIEDKKNRADHARTFGAELPQLLGRFKISGSLGLVSDQFGAEFVHGMIQGMYNPKGKSKKEFKTLEKILVYSNTNSEAITRARHVSRAATLTRALGDAPPNELNPENFAASLKVLAERSGIECEVFDERQLTELGMGSFLSVGQASQYEPRMVILKVAGKDRSRTVALVGKGVTFDSGGLSLKTRVGMEAMKYDMLGAGTVVGTAFALAEVQPATDVVVAVGLVENVIGPSATRPSDIVTAYNGKTIEILNTDAEGRLVLADVLSYIADKYDPELIVDCATLTGAMVIALGSFGCGYFASDDATAQRLEKACQKSLEPCWRLPIWEGIPDTIKSDFADYRNIADGSVSAGSIVAAGFLREFTADKPWLHLDIAGVGDGARIPGLPRKGASGFGVRTLVEMLV